MSAELSPRSMFWHYDQMSRAPAPQSSSLLPVLVVHEHTPMSHQKFYSPCESIAIWKSQSHYYSSALSMMGTIPDQSLDG